MKRGMGLLSSALLLLLTVSSPASAIIKSWRNVLAGQVNAVAVTTSPTTGQPSILFAGTLTGVRKSVDGGATWTSVSTSQVNSLAVDPGNPAVIYAAGAGGLFKSVNYGQTWAAVNAFVPIKNWISVSPFDSKILFGDNKRSTDSGATWTSMIGFPTAVNSSLHIRCSRDPVFPNFMLAAANEYSYRSDDGGANWRMLQRDVDSVEIDPTDARYYYLGGRCGDQITRYSPDANGAIVSKIVGPDHIHGMAVDPTNHARVFAYDDGGSTYTSTNFFSAYQSGAGSLRTSYLGRMIFDGSNGQVLLPTSQGLMVKDSWCLDADSDGFSPSGGVCGTLLDCNDASAAFAPGHVENCLDSADNNCNGQSDMADAYCISFCSDRDGDQHLALGCPGGDDCYDYDVTVYPGAVEICDWTDNNCNSLWDEGFDLDGDGHSSCGGDCNDGNSLISPSAQESCDGIDNDCNPATVEQCPRPLFAWGDNAFGQLGDGSLTDRKGPVAVSGVTPWVAGSGYNHSLALLEGMVWAWGSNATGQLGDGTTTLRNTPAQVLNAAGSNGYLDDVQAVAGGRGHTLALKQDGSLWAWGDNAKGQLGDCTKASSSRPVQVAFISYASAVAAGADHSLALYWGQVVSWGDNSKSQLGDGSSVNRNSPVYVDGLYWDYHVVTAIAAGSYHSLALKSDGTVWAWGDNSKGQLGDGTFTPRKTPVQVAGLNNVVAISAGWYHSVALKSDGTVWVWGENRYGQVGDGTSTTRKTATMVPGLTGVTAVAAGSYHNLAVTPAGAKAWGYNKDGQLGDGTTTNRLSPVPVPGSAGFTTVSAGAAHSVARK